MTWMKRVAYVAGALFVLIAAILAIGASIPVHHTATSEARLAASPEAVFGIISDIDAGPEWRSAVERVEHLPESVGSHVFREHGDYGPMTMQRIDFDPPHRMVVEIFDDNLPFGGRWTYSVEPAPEGALVRITEDGEIYNLMFRFMSRLRFWLQRDHGDLSPRPGGTSWRQRSGRSLELGTLLASVVAAIRVLI